ncbi:atrial natriuretic peptide-converting enzyme-like [Glandiceps talaboti]
MFKVLVFLTVVSAATFSLKAQSRIERRQTDCTGDDLFTCDDGICIPAEHRCNAKNDCSDNSDEFKCPFKCQTLLLS